MKKVSALLVAVVLLFSMAFAEVAGMSDDELYALMNQIRSELTRRSAYDQGKIIIIDNDELTIYCTGSGKESFLNEFDMEVVFMNKTDHSIGVSFDHVVINGWEVGHITQLSAIVGGRKTKDYISLPYKDAELSSHNEIEDVALVFHTFNADTYRTETKYDEITIDLKGVNWK